MLAVVHDLAEAQGESPIPRLQVSGTDKRFKSETLPRERVSPKERSEDWKQ